MLTTILLICTLATALLILVMILMKPRSENNDYQKLEALQQQMVKFEQDIKT